MTPQTLLTELRTRGVVLIPEGSALRYRAPKGALTPDLRKALEEQKAAIMAALSGAEKPKDANRAKSERGNLGSLDKTTRPPAGPLEADLTTGSFCALLLRSAVLDGALVWLVADDGALGEHPDILRSGFPVFFFDEVEQLRGKTPEELRAVAMVKTVFPTGRVLQ